MTDLQRDQLTLTYFDAFYDGDLEAGIEPRRLACYDKELSDRLDAVDRALCSYFKVEVPEEMLERGRKVIAEILARY